LNGADDGLCRSDRRYRGKYHRQRQDGCAEALDEIPMFHDRFLLLAAARTRKRPHQQPASAQRRKIRQEPERFRNFT
jgi:hypothetical protein